MYLKLNVYINDIRAPQNGHRIDIFNLNVQHSRPSSHLANVFRIYSSGKRVHICLVISHAGLLFRSPNISFKFWFHTRTKKIISWSRWFHKLEFKSSVLCFEHNTNISLNRSDKRKASKEFLNCFHHKYKVNLEHKADFSLFVICDMFLKMISNCFKLFDAFKVLSKKKQR